MTGHGTRCSSKGSCPGSSRDSTGAQPAHGPLPPSDRYRAWLARSTAASTALSCPVLGSVTAKWSFSAASSCVIRASVSSLTGSGTTSVPASGGRDAPARRSVQAAKTSLSGLSSISPPRYSRTIWTTSLLPMSGTDSRLATVAAARSPACSARLRAASSFLSCSSSSAARARRSGASRIGALSPAAAAVPGSAVPVGFVPVAASVAACSSPTRRAMSASVALARSSPGPGWSMRWTFSTMPARTARFGWAAVNRPLISA